MTTIERTLVDAVLTAPPPSFAPSDAEAIVRRVFGIEGTATAAPSERDQAFLIDGDRPVVLKISNVAEDPDRLDMEALVARRVAQVDPGIPVALPWLVPGAARSPDDPAAYRAAVPSTDGEHQVRLYDRLPGAPWLPEGRLNDRAVHDWGVMAARVGRALRGFMHPASVRVMLWDPQHAARLRPLLGAVADVAIRDLVGLVLDRYDLVVAPRWPTLRAQVVHTDLCPGNVLVDGDGSVTGVLDFGDASWSALVVDPAAALETLLDGRSTDDFFRSARLLLDGYEKVTPLEAEEREIVGELLAARMASAIVVPASRAGVLGPAARRPAEEGHPAVMLLRTFESLGWDDVARRLGGRQPGRGWSVPALAERRTRALGPALTGLSYREPIHLVGGDGAWLTDADGRRFLDAYNNVPVVGHGHPRVVEAIVRQARRLNTNMRYLHETALEVAERLTASTGGTLDVVMFVNSGSEANDLAWRMARAATGGSGGIATDYAYHGVTEAISALSPEDWGVRSRPDHVRTWRPPDPIRGVQATLADFDTAVRELVAGGHRPAAAILDGILTSDGIVDLDRELAVELVRRSREAGALWIADEVQGGYGRTGEAMWSYQRLGLEPDFVTLGKPMGNGHPVAAVLTRRDIAERFAAETDFFSTFGGNPVAMAAALAVLEVVDDEGIVDRARAVGGYVAGALRRLASATPRMAEVRAIGLAIGVEIVRPGTLEPDPDAAQAIVEGLRASRVLIGTTGRAGNSLKIRPPLVFGRAEADVLVETLARVVEALDARPPAPTGVRVRPAPA